MLTDGGLPQQPRPCAHRTALYAIERFPSAPSRAVSTLEDLYPSQCIVIGKQAFSGCELRRRSRSVCSWTGQNKSDVYTGTITIGRRRSELPFAVYHRI